MKCKLMHVHNLNDDNVISRKTTFSHKPIKYSIPTFLINACEGKKLTEIACIDHHEVPSLRDYGGKPHLPTQSGQHVSFGL